MFRARSDRSNERLRDRTARRGGAWENGFGNGHSGARKARTTMCNCTSENLEIPGLRLAAHPGMTDAFDAHHAAFAVCASEAKVLPSEASCLSSGAGSSEGSLVSFA